MTNYQPLILFLIICIILYLFLERNSVIEGFSETTNIDFTALQNIASIYNNKELTVDKLNVTGDITAGGNIITTGQNIAIKHDGKYKARLHCPNNNETYFDYGDNLHFRQNEANPIKMNGVNLDVQDIYTDSINKRGDTDDYLRINNKSKKSGRVALFGSLGVNENWHGYGGLAVGKWTGNGTGIIYASST